jgi:hypothetical protein
MSTKNVKNVIHKAGGKLAPKDGALKPPPKKKAKRKRPIGRPAFVPTQAQKAWVELAASMGGSLEYVGRFIPGGPISIDTARKHFVDELKYGREKAVIQIASRQFQNAMSASPSAHIERMFYLKCRAGWSDRPREEGTGVNIMGGKPGEPMRITLTIGSERDGKN